MPSQASSVPRASRERRRRIRHKIHSPAYTSMNGNLTGTVLDLNGIVDINEDGMCFQSSSQREPSETFDLSLDLSETKGYINVRGRVVWSEPSGRTGVIFQKMSPESLQRLQEWLFINTIVANANYLPPSMPPPDAMPLTLPARPEAQLLPDYTAMLTAVAAVKREVEALGVDVDAALQLAADRALMLTRATGAAVALSDGTSMVCRASSGPDAPGLGVRLDNSSGFSGECVRTGRLIHCEDSETDARVDRETCRMLGVRSLMAAPIRTSTAVIGLIEVFSPLPDAFTEADGIGMQRLAEIILASLHRAIQAMATNHPIQFPSAPAKEVPLYSSYMQPEPRRKLLRGGRFYILAIAAALILLSAIFMVPRIWNAPRTSAPHPQPANQPREATLKPTLQAGTPAARIAELRRSAEKGDATAQFSLGVHYALGEDVKLDYAEAARWYTLAAEQGHILAQSNLGAYYWAGTGVRKDINKAYFWTLLAQTGGDEPSRLRMAYLPASMSRGDILTVQQQVNDWLKQHHYIAQTADASNAVSSSSN